MISQELLNELISAFKQEMQSMRTVTLLYNKPFVNKHNEFIACPAINAYFRLEDCITRRDIQIKILHWLSRDASKAVVPSHFKKFVRNGANLFLGTDFVEDDWLLIYERLGNGINIDLTYDFIDCEFDINLLKEHKNHAKV